MHKEAFQKRIREGQSPELSLCQGKKTKMMENIIMFFKGIVVNFCDNHGNQYFVYRRISIDDDSIHHSKHHPNLDDVASLWTKKSTQAYRTSRNSYAQESPTDVPPKIRSRKQDPGNVSPISKSKNNQKLSYFLKKTKEKRKKRKICPGPANLSMISFRIFGK